MVSFRFRLRRGLPTLRRPALSPRGFWRSYDLARLLAAGGRAPSFLFKIEGNGARGPFAGLLFLACHCAWSFLGCAIGPGECDSSKL